MRGVLSLLVAAAVVSSAAESTPCTIRLENITSVHTAGSIVELSVSSLPRLGTSDIRQLATHFILAFDLPRDVLSELEVSGIRCESQNLVLQLKFKDAQTASAVEKLIREKRPGI